MATKHIFRLYEMHKNEWWFLEEYHSFHSAMKAFEALKAAKGAENAKLVRN